MVVLVYLLGYSHAEAGAVMGIEATTVASHLQTARRTLEPKLRNYLKPGRHERKDQP